MAQQKVEKFDDESSLWFGQHKGKKLANVPASYLLWGLGENDPKITGRPVYGLSAGLLAYIEENMDALDKGL